jgi:hypothetical protein
VGRVGDWLDLFRLPLAPPVRFGQHPTACAYTVPLL